MLTMLREVMMFTNTLEGIAVLKFAEKDVDKLRFSRNAFRIRSDTLLVLDMEMILTVLSSWCQTPVISFTSMPKGRKCFPKGTLLIRTCTLFCIIQGLAKCDIINDSRTADLKYILMWTTDTVSPFSYWKTGKDIFLEKKCQFSNCYITSRRDFFGGNLTKFDAVLFNGRNLKNVNASDMPRQRSYHQKYIFLNLESSDNQPICNSLFDGFFNWTATYKLNSDIYLPYMLIRNISGDEVGPRVDMAWVDDMSACNDTLLESFNRRTKAAAWFASHCYTRSKREKYAANLNAKLRKLNLTLDVYGDCGTKVCPRNNQHVCDDLVRNTYFFYLSFENSITEDYITEKVLNALLNDVVPILYGGANYSRYLPPGSYIDARKYKPKVLASVMELLIRTPTAYQDFFRWKNHYTYHSTEYVCRLCAALNNQIMLETRTVYNEFRRWWNPDYKQRCKDKTWGS